MKTILNISILLTAATLLAGCGGSGMSVNDTSNEADKKGLKRATSSAELEGYLKQSLLETYGKISQPIDYSADTGTVPVATETSVSSSTNTQESNVDEADRLKNDSQYLYVSNLTSPTVTIFAADASASKIGQLTLDTENAARLSGLYLRGDRSQLLALSGDGNQIDPIWDMWLLPQHWQQRQTDVFEIDVSTPQTPFKATKISLDGQLISSRRIGSILYLATRHTPSLQGLISYPGDEVEAEANRILIERSNLNDMLPAYQLNGVDQGKLLSPDACFITQYAQQSYTQSSIISLIAIDLDNPATAPQARCFVGDAETIYASTKALYLATTQYRYSNNNGVSIYNGQPTTDIHKFSLNAMQAEYRGSISLNGHLGWQQSLKPFRMSEHNGVLRVITYTGDQAGSEASPAHLYTVQEKVGETALEMLAELPNAAHPEPLGKLGEQIYATRFMGDRAYLVTFRVTDPLYMLDLSNPSDPQLISELNIDGYSDYLHPVGEHYLLGIGKDAVADSAMGDGRGAWYQGVKLSLIDISDPTTPFETQQIILGKRGTETAVSQSHHALTSLQQGNTLQLALPLSLHDTVSNYGGTGPSEYFDWTRDELYRLNIDTQTGAIETLPAIVAKTAPDAENSGYSQLWPHDRSAIIDARTYYLHGDTISVSPSSE